MPTFTYPGVYVEELSNGVHTITGVATSIAAFVGWAPQGPVNQATLVESWPEYEAAFGGFDTRSLLGYAVNQFFSNGGQQAYIVRLVWDGTLPAALTNPAVCATAVAAGIGSASAQITAAVGKIVSSAATLSVGTPVLQSIAITPNSLPPIPINVPVNFVATGTNSDGSTVNLTASATWSTSDSTVIGSVTAGKAVPAGPGMATITATDSSGLISGSIAVVVSAASLSSINVTPAAPSIAAGQTQQLAATGKYSDSSTQDLTALATWGPSGDFSTTTPGLFNSGAGATVTAVWGPMTSAGDVIVVGPKALVSIVITPATPTGTIGQTVPFKATGVYSDSTSADITSTATWTESNSVVATLTANSAKGTNAGSTTVTATSGGVSGSTTLNVTAATLNSISITPSTATIANGLTVQMKALGVYSDGSTVDLTNSTAWTSSNTADVTVTSEQVNVSAGSATLTSGLGQGVGVTGAPVTISAAWQGVTGTSQVSVAAAALKSIAVTPSPYTILSGQTQQFKATATYTDSSTSDITSSATWSASPTTVATISSTGLAKAVAAGGSLTLFAADPGAWGNKLRVSITVSPTDTTRFNILVQEVGASGALQTLENFTNLSVSSTDSQYVVSVVDQESHYITFINPKNNTPVVPSATPSPTNPSNPIALSGGADGGVLKPATDQNFEKVILNKPYGAYLLDRVNIFNLLCIPGETDMPTISQMQAYCALKRAFYIVDCAQSATYTSLLSSGPAGTNTGSITAGTNPSNSAFYFPWVKAPDPLAANRPTLFPPCGFVAGIYASTDASRGVWKAPAGITTGLTGVNGLQYNLTDLENGDLNIQGINCLREFKTYGDVVWGARTLLGNDAIGSQWKYVPIRRLALFIESSLYIGTQWVVFEPNDEPLWSQIRLNVGTFMQGLFLQGAFEGSTPQQAYFVKCDSDNNPQSSIDLGIVNIQVGFAPLFPAEFVVIQIVQMAGQTS